MKFLELRCLHGAAIFFQKKTPPSIFTTYLSYLYYIIELDRKAKLFSDYTTIAVFCRSY